MANSVLISKKIKNFNCAINNISGDKSLSIRWALMASQAIGKSRAFNILNSEDVNNTLISLKKLGIKVKKKNNYCEITGKGLNSFSYKNEVYSLPTHFPIISSCVKCASFLITIPKPGKILKAEANQR